MAKPLKVVSVVVSSGISGGNAGMVTLPVTKLYPIPNPTNGRNSSSKK
jgi:hypothetical protein